MARRSVSRRIDPARTEVVTVLALAVLSIAFFVAFPRIDLVVSGWFYTPGAGFTWGSNTIVRALYLAVLWVPRVAMVGLLIVVVASLFVRRGWLHVHRVRLMFLFMTGVLGTGVAVNAVLKEQWGRARPVAIAEFGGTAQYTPPYQMSAQCPHNCAFTSGHAASVFSLLAFGRLHKTNAKRARRRWLMIGLAAGTVVGLARIAQGAHFLSDVVFSFFVVYLVIEVVDRVFQWFIAIGEPSSESAEPKQA